MPIPPEEVRRVMGGLLDFRVLDREPSSFRAWRQRNEVLTALAHLLGYDGAVARAIRCTSGGVLRIVLEDANGDALAIDPSGKIAVTGAGGSATEAVPVHSVGAWLDAAAEAYIDLTTAADRVVRMTAGGPSSMDIYFKYGESTNGSTFSKVLGYCQAGVSLDFVTTTRYVALSNEASYELWYGFQAWAL